jgi:hypothetical protein
MSTLPLICLEMMLCYNPSSKTLPSDSGGCVRFRKSPEYKPGQPESTKMVAIRVTSITNQPTVFISGPSSNFHPMVHLPRYALYLSFLFFIPIVCEINIYFSVINHPSTFPSEGRLAQMDESTGEICGELDFRCHISRPRRSPYMPHLTQLAPHTKPLLIYCLRHLNR